MNKKIVIINGNGGVGKDTFVNMCASYKKVKKYSTVDTIKKAASILGWQTTMKSEKDRKFLSDLKYLSSKYNDLSYKEILENINEFNNDDNEILFLFIREIDEIKRVKELTGALTLLITNKNTKFISSNEADKDVLNYDYDYVIENSLNEIDLKKKVEEFLNTLFK